MAKRRGREFWERHLAGWRQSGLAQVAYCASHRLNIKSFARWRRKEKECAQASGLPLTLVPVSLSVPATGSAVMLHSPGGWKIEIPAGNLSWLPDLLRQLP